MNTYFPYYIHSCPFPFPGVSHCYQFLVYHPPHQRYSLHICICTPFIFIEIITYHKCYSAHCYFFHLIYRILRWQQDRWERSPLPLDTSETPS